MWVTRHDYSGAETVMFGEAERLRSASKIMHSVTVQPWDLFDHDGYLVVPDTRNSPDN